MRKKLICLLLVFMFLCAAGFPAGAAGFTDTNGTRYETAANVLSALGFISGQGDGAFDVNSPMTRAEFASVIARMSKSWGLNIGSDATYFYDVREGYWAKNAIDSVTNAGLMAGENNFFRPDEPITTEEAACALVIFLGYDYLAQKQSYTLAAVQIGLLRSVQSTNQITRGELLIMLYNALDIDLLSVTRIVQSANGVLTTQKEAVKNATILTEYFDIYKSRGQVTAVGNLDMVTYTNNETNIVRIDNEEYELAEGMSADTGVLGCIVDFYYRAAADDDIPVLMYYNVRKENEIIEVSAGNVAAGNTTTSFTYFDENGRRQTQKLSAGARFILNGYFIPDSAKKDGLFDIAAGSVRIVIPSDDSAELVWIQSYAYHLVKAAGNDGIYLKDGGYIDLDDTNGDIEAFFYMANGTPTTLNKIVSDSAVALAETQAADGKTYRSIYVLKSVTGKVEEIGGDTDREKIMLDGVQYDAADGVMNWGLRLGLSYKFFIGMDGEICLFQEAKSGSLRYGYLIEVGTSGGINTALQMKILNEGGAVSLLEVANTFYINDIAVKEGGVGSAQAYNQYLYDAAQGKAIRQVVAYMLNEQNEVARIYTALDNEDAVLSLDVPRATRRLKASSIFNFGGELAPKRDGIMFVVPSDTNADETDYAVWPLTAFTNDASYSVEGYNVDDLREADVIVVTVANTDVTNFIANGYTCVFDKKSRVVLEDGTETWAITYWQQNQKRTMTILPRDGKSTYQKTMEAARDIKRGDCFKMELTSDSTQIKNIEIEFSNAQRTTMTSNYNDARLLYYGQMTAIGPLSFVATAYSENAEDNYLGKISWLFKNAARVSTYLYTGDDEEIQYCPNGLADVKVGDWILYQAYCGGGRTMVIYRDDDRLPSGALK